MSKLFLIAALVAVSVGAWGVAGASATGPPIVNETTHPVDMTFAFPAGDPCSGASVLVVGTGSGVSHFVLFADGRGEFTDTLTGTIVTYLLDDQGNPTTTIDSTGSFTSWDGSSGLFDANGNPIGQTVSSSTFDTRQTTSTGQRFTAHFNGHTLTDQLGTIKLAFTKFHAHCV